MFNNVTHSPPSNLFSFKFEATSHGLAFYVVILSTSVSNLSPLVVVANGLILAAIWGNPSLNFGPLHMVVGDPR